MRRTSLWMLCLAAGCAADGRGSDGFVAAGPALQARGVYAYQAASTSDGASSTVALRGASGQSIGRLELERASDMTSVALTFGADDWSQIVVTAHGQMVLALDGRRATLTWDGTGWSGGADGAALLRDSQPFVELVHLIGADAHLAGPSAPSPSSSSTGGTTAPSPSHGPADMGTPPPKLCCGDVVVTASGWAWYWEKAPDAEACKRATDSLQASCEVSSGADCCNLPAKGACTSCVNWGTGWACSTAGYLQYVCQ